MPLPLGDIVLWKVSYRTEDFEQRTAEVQAAKRATAALLKKSGPFRFLDLGPEIRTMIYQYALTSSYGIYCSHSYKDRKTRSQEQFFFSGDYTAGLLYTCKAVYEEARKVALGQNSIRFFSTRIALQIMRHYMMDQEKRSYNIQIDQNLHSHEGLRSDPNAQESGEPQFLQIIDFCKQNPHIQVQLNITDIMPGDLPYEGQTDEPESVKWYNCLLARKSEIPRSLKMITFQLDRDEWAGEEYSFDEWYYLLEPKLRVWGPGVVGWPWPIAWDYDTSDED